MMTITATEFKTNMGKYLDLVSREDIYITRNGKEVAKVSRPDTDRLALMQELTGIIAGAENINEQDIKEERLSRQ